MVTISLTEDDLMTALRGFLLSVVTAEVEVVKTQRNRVAMPKGPFVAMTTLFFEAKSTNVSAYSDASGIEMQRRTSIWKVQLDFYGANSASDSTLVSALLRSEFACLAFAQSNPNIQPLFAGEPRNTNMINGEQQFEDRWTLDADIQYVPIITTPMDFASELSVGVVEVEANFPSGA